MAAASSFILNSELNQLLNFVPFVLILIYMLDGGAFNKKILLSGGAICLLMIYSFAVDEINMYSRVRWISLFQVVVLFIVMSKIITKDKVINGQWVHYCCGLVFISSLFFTLYPALGVSDGTAYDAFYQARITGGINNTGFTLYCLYSIIIVTAFNDQKVSTLRIVTILIMSIILLVYPSRQVQVATVLLLLVMLTRFKKVKLNKFNIMSVSIGLILIIGLYSDVIFSLIELSFDRTIKNIIDQQEDYSRITQYKIAIELFSENILFGGGADPNMVLERYGVDVFESSISDVAVRYGILGMLSVFVAIFILLNNRRNWFEWLLTMPIFSFLLFNEVIYEEIFWFTIIYMAASKALLSRGLTHQ